MCCQRGGGGFSIPHHTDFHANIGSGKMSVPNCIDKAVLSFGYQYGLGLGPIRPTQKERASGGVFTHAGRSQSASPLQGKAADT